MLLGLEGLENRVMPDLVHKLIRPFGAEVFTALQIASRGRFGFHFGTIVVAGFSAESELMRRHIQRRVTLLFEFGLPSPPWMTYSFGRNLLIHPA